MTRLRLGISQVLIRFNLTLPGLLFFLKLLPETIQHVIVLSGFFLGLAQIIIFDYNVLLITIKGRIFDNG